MLEVTTALLLTAHLLLVNVAMAGPLVAVWLDWRARRQSDAASAELSGELGRQLAWCSAAALVLGSLLGGVLLAVRYYADDGYFRAAAAIPTDRLWFALVELLFSLVCLTVYAGLWNRWRRARFVHRLLALAAATNLLAHFPALFVIISVIDARRPLPAEPLDRAAYQRLLIDSEVLSRVVHLWLAAGAVTGMLLVLLVLRRKGSAESPAHQVLVKSAARLTLTLAMLQFPVGLWVALAMPAAMRAPLLGSDAVAAILFLAALMLAMLLLHVVSPLALGSIGPHTAWRGTAVLVALILLMIGVRVRLNELAGRPAALPVGLVSRTIEHQAAVWPLRPTPVPLQ